MYFMAFRNLVGGSMEVRQSTCCSLNRSYLMYTGNKTTLIMFETPLGFLKILLSQAIDFILECGLQVLWCDLK